MNIFEKHKIINTYKKCEKDHTREYMINKYLPGFSNKIMAKFVCDIALCNSLNNPYKCLIIKDNNSLDLNNLIINMINSIPSYYFVVDEENRFIKNNKKQIVLKNNVIIYFINSTCIHGFCGISEITHILVNEESYNDHKLITQAISCTPISGYNIVKY